jgi:hypothetical protein
MDGHSNLGPIGIILSVALFIVAQAAAGDEPAAPPLSSQVITAPNGVRIEVSLPDGTKNNEQAVVEALEAVLQQMKGSPVTPVSGPASLPPAPEPRKDMPIVIPEEVIPGEPVLGGPLDQPWHVTYLPQTLLWQPPLAQPGQPRTYFLYSSADEFYTSETIDTAIGGTFALLRYGACDDCLHAMQADFFAVVFSRFAHHSRLNAADYRFGYPLTFAWGPWEGKIGYEHTSTHIGDELLQVTPDFRQELIRDEVVLAIGYRFLNQLRVYGQFAYCLDIRTPGIENQRDRYNLGIEWYRNEKSPWYGQPFAAFDADIRGDQDYNLNVTAQAGWMWRNPCHRPFLRVLVEYYHGRSLYGHFSDQNERWVAAGVALDY